MTEQIFAAIVTGLATGSIFAIAAMGLVLTYKTSGTFNFAHGTLAAAGAYVMWELWQVRGWPWPIALVAALILVGVIGGLLLERMAYGLANQTTTARIVATIGLLISLEGLLILRYGSATIQMPYFLPLKTLKVGGIYVSYEQIIVFALALAAAVGLGVFFHRFRLGVAMQGVVDDPSLLAMQGVDPVYVRRRAWIIGSCFATISGALLAPTLGLDATLLTLLVIQAFGAAAIGRFQSLPLTYVGGLVVGVGQSLAAFVVGEKALTSRISGNILQPIPSNVPFLILFVVLLVTPKAKLVERGARVIRREAAPPRSSPAAVAVASVLGLALLIALPHLAPTKLPVFSTALVYVIIFASLYLLIRTAGQVSLCHLMIAGVGAATFAHMVGDHVPFLLAALIGGLIAVPVGAFIAIPAIRMSGLFLGIATFGFGILVQNLFFPTYFLFGESQNLSAPRPSFARSDSAYYYVVLAVTIVVCLVVLGIRKSRLGRLLRALADAPNAVEAHGSSTNVIRVLAFCASAFLAGLAGAISGPITESASGTSFTYSTSLIIVAVLFIAGRRPILSSFVAAAAYIVVPSYIHSSNVSTWEQVIFGALAIMVSCDVFTLLRRRLAKAPRLVGRNLVPNPAEARMQRLAELT